MTSRLFMTGLFRERVERAASIGYYVVEGKRAYRWSPSTPGAREDRQAPYRRLAEGFESYASVLDYTRRVHFFDHPVHALLPLSLRMTRPWATRFPAPPS